MPGVGGESAASNTFNAPWCPPHCFTVSECKQSGKEAEHCQQYWF
jgi:hypothetical protein